MSLWRFVRFGWVFSNAVWRLYSAYRPARESAQPPGGSVQCSPPVTRLPPSSSPNPASPFPDSRNCPSRLLHRFVCHTGRGPSSVLISSSLERFVLAFQGWTERRRKYHKGMHVSLAMWPALTYDKRFSSCLL